MATLKKDTDGLWRLRYSVTWTDGRKKQAPLKRKKQKAQLLEALDLAKNIEEATANRRATNAEIDHWVEKKLLPFEWAEQIFVGYGDTAKRQGGVEPVDWEVLRQAFSDFMLGEEKDGDATRETHYNHMNMYDQVAKWVRSKHPTLVTLTANDVVEYKRRLKIEEHLAESTVNNRLQKLKYLLQLAVDKNMVATSAYVEGGLKREKVKDSKRRRVYSEKEIRMILKRLADRAEFYADMSIMNGCWPIACYLAYFAGLRNEEIVWLSWDAIDFDDDTLTVEQTTCKATGRKWTSKTVTWRTGGLNAMLKEHLLAERDRQKKMGILGQFVLVGGKPVKMTSEKKQAFFKKIDDSDCDCFHRDNRSGNGKDAANNYKTGQHAYCGGCRELMETYNLTYSYARKLWRLRDSSQNGMPANDTRGGALRAPISTKRLNLQWNEFYQREGFDTKLRLPKPTFYSFRHTFATMLLRGGTDIVTVQDRMGHKLLETTMQYLHYIPSETQVENSLPH